VPLANVLISSAFPAVINCVTKSDDHSVWQNGGECLRAYTSVAPDQVYEYRCVQEYIILQSVSSFTDSHSPLCDTCLMCVVFL
jgi:hypothetical protein